MRAEKRVDAQEAREIRVALPVELSKDEQRALVIGYVKEQFVARGMVADFCIHEATVQNPHAHTLLTTREIGADGFGKKDRSWNNRDLVLEWREELANHANRASLEAGHDARIDHRSHMDRGIGLKPTRHLGIPISEVRRQSAPWMRDALRAMGAGKAAVGIEAYRSHGAFRGHESQEAAIEAVLDDWLATQRKHPGCSQLLLAYTKRNSRWRQSLLLGDPEDRPERLAKASEQLRSEAWRSTAGRVKAERELEQKLGAKPAPIEESKKYHHIPPEEKLAAYERRSARAAEAWFAWRDSAPAAQVMAAWKGEGQGAKLLGDFRNLRAWSQEAVRELQAHVLWYDTSRHQAPDAADDREV